MDKEYAVSWDGEKVYAGGFNTEQDAINAGNLAVDLVESQFGFRRGFVVIVRDRKLIIGEWEHIA